MTTKRSDRSQPMGIESVFPGEAVGLLQCLLRLVAREVAANLLSPGGGAAGKGGQGANEESARRGDEPAST
jgi:hypothetical protein